MQIGQKNVKNALSHNFEKVIKMIVVQKCNDDVIRMAAITHALMHHN